MIPRRPNILFSIISALALASVSTSVLACASCGCTLSSDWESQGFTVKPGLKVDFRYDYLNQNQLRHDTGTISAANASQMVTEHGRSARGREIHPQQLSDPGAGLHV